MRRCGEQVGWSFTALCPAGRLERADRVQARFVSVFILYGIAFWMTANFDIAELAFDLLVVCAELVNNVLFLGTQSDVLIVDTRHPTRSIALSEIKKPQAIRAIADGQVFIFCSSFWPRSCYCPSHHLLAAAMSPLNLCRPSL